jgi:hypothetical protein
LFDDSILTINELAKVRASAGSGGGGAGTQFTSTGIPRVARAQFRATSLDYITYGVNNQSSQSYTKAFNHGGGQFSFANCPTYDSGATTSQFYVQPFTVNQTTGAITKGTGSAVWSNGSGNGGVSTGTWGQGYNGQHCFHHGHNVFPGNGTSNRTYGTTAWVVSGNSVSGGTYTTNNSYATLSNEESFTGVSGTTSYWMPNVYNGNAYKHLYSYTPGSLSNTSNENLSSNTSTNYTISVAKQFGTTGVQGGGLHFYQNSNGLGQVRAYNSSGSTLSTYAQQDIMTANYSANTQAVGIELSNGNQLYYTNNGTVILKSGSTLSNVTSSADYLPIETNSFRPLSWFTPVSQDTWFAFNPSVNELVKFRVNPSTYKITIVGSKVITNLLNNNSIAREYTGRYTGVWVTGSNNQFIVAVTTSQSSAPVFTVTVGQNSLIGA